MTVEKFDVSATIERVKEQLEKELDMSAESATGCTMSCGPCSFLMKNAVPTP